MASNPKHPPLISHRHHPAVKRIRSLHGRASRERSGTFLVDGMRFVAQAMKHNVPIETLVLCPDLLVHPFGQKLARQLRRAGTATLEVNQEVYFNEFCGFTPRNERGPSDQPRGPD